MSYFLRMSSNVIYKLTNVARCSNIPFCRSLISRARFSTLSDRFVNENAISWPNLPIVTTVAENPRTVEIIIPGYDHKDKDRAGNVSLHKIGHLSEARVLMMKEVVKKLNPLDGQITKLIVILSVRYVIHPGFYDNRHFNAPVRYRSRVVNVGKSSYGHVEEVTSLKTGQRLHETFLTIVVIDRLSRDSAPIPDAVRLFCGTTVESVPRVVALERPSGGGGTLVVHDTIRWSDADFYRHTNHNSYVRICLDAIALLAIEGKLGALKHDPALLHATRMTALNISETLPGDRVRIHVWEDELNPMTLKCDMVNERNKSAFQLCVDFVYPQHFTPTINTDDYQY